MKFNYTAVDASGNKISGLTDAENSRGAAEAIARLGYTPLQITKQETKPKDIINTPRRKKPDAAELQLFAQQMASMLKAGVPIMRALGATSDPDAKSNISAIASDISVALQSGKPLAQAMSQHPECFDNYFLAMIKVGEATGAIDAIFKRLHGHLEFQRQMKDQMKAALRYPAIVIGVIFIALFIVNFFVIPAFAKVYQGFKAELPFFTKLLMATSDAIINYWWLIGIGFFGLIMLVKSWVKTKNGELLWDEWKLKIPVIGNIAHKAILARFAQSLSLALSSGLPVSTAISLVGETTGNAWIAQKLSLIKTQLERGETLYRSCHQSGAFNTPTLQMILVGEESGTLDEMLNEISNLYQEQVEYDLKNIGAQLEPILLLLLGGLVLVLALGIFLPIWGLSSAAFQK